MCNYRNYLKILFSKCYIFFLLLTIPLLTHPVKRFNHALTGLVNNNFSMVDKAFLKTGLKTGNDQLLSLYELGSFYYLNGNFKKSADFFNIADTVAHAYEDDAVISMNATRRYSGALLTNDSAIRYEGFSYEKVMSRTLNAVNYLFLGDVEGAQVELRKAEEYQRFNREKHKQKSSNIKSDKLMGNVANLYPNLGGINLSDNESTVNALYGKMFDQVKNVRNSFENAFTYFFASQIYLAQGDRGIDDAMVSIKRAYELMPNVPYIKSSYLDIARAHSQYSYDEARAQLRISRDSSSLSDNKSTGSVVVCFAVGHAPNMESSKISFMISDNIYTLAFPIYNNFDIPQIPLTIRTPSDTIVTTTITDIRCLAIKSLQERMPELIGRNVLGAIVKAELQGKIRESSGSFAGFIASIVSLSTSSADCRSWLSLPAELQIAKFNLNAGSNKVTLLHGYNWTESLTLDIKAGSNTLIWVRSLPGFRRIDTKTL